MATAVGSPSRALDVLFVDSDTDLRSYAPLFSPALYHLNATSHVPVAVEYIRRNSPAMVVTELALDDGSGLEICVAAKALPVPATVLATASDPAPVPDALAAGCDGVLLKPFAPNLLVARVGRLLRERSNQLRLQAARSLSKSSRLTESTDLPMSGTNRKWPNTHCPYCTQSGVTSFDFASMRRAWYACLSCRRVWIARRQE